MKQLTYPVKLLKSHLQRLKFCALIMLIISNINLYSQTMDFCATPSNIPNFFNAIQTTQLKATASSYNIGIFFHIMRRSDGTGGQTQQEVNSALSTLISDYQPYNQTSNTHVI